jgi:hypothetical protein
MTGKREPALVKRYRERLDAQGIPEGLKVTVRLSGGMPSERIEHEFELTGDGKATVNRLDALSDASPQATSSQLSPAETQQVLGQIAAGLPGVVRREDAHFLPDTVVGIVTVEVDGKAQTFYFDAEEGRALEGPGEAEAPPGMRSAVQTINLISDRLLADSGGQEP